MNIFTFFFCLLHFSLHSLLFYLLLFLLLLFLFVFFGGELSKLCSWVIVEDKVIIQVVEFRFVYE